MEVEGTESGLSGNGEDAGRQEKERAGQSQLEHAALHSPSGHVVC